MVSGANVDAGLAACFKFPLALEFCRVFQYGAVRAEDFEVLERRLAVGVKDLEGRLPVQLCARCAHTSFNIET